MYTIQQDSANKLVIPFNGTDYDFLLIVFTYSCYESVGIFENTAGIGCDYEIVVNEVGSKGTADPENGDVKISPRSTWKGEIYGQDDNVNLFPQYAVLIEQYKFQVKGDSCKVYPNLSPQIDCLPATAIVQDQDGNELARENIASGATGIITAPNATAVVKDQNGNILATESIPSGGSKDIIIEVPSNIQEPLAVTNGGTVLYFDSSRSKTNWQETQILSSTNKDAAFPLNIADTDGQNVGTIFDLSPNAMFAASETSSSNALVLSSDGNKNTGYRSELKSFIIPNSKQILKNLHATSSSGNREYTIAIKIKKLLDNSLQRFITNSSTTAASGLFMQLTSDNKISIVLLYGSAGNNIVSYTTTQTINISDDWSSVILMINGTSGIIRIKGVEESFVLSTVGNDSSNAQLNLCIGGIEGITTNKFNGYWDDFLILDRVITSSEILDYESYNPTRNDVDYFTLEREYDFNDNSLMYQDLAKTLPVNAGDNVFVVESKVPYNFGGRKLDLSSVTGAEPTYNTSLQNSLGGLSYTSGKRLLFDIITSRGGSFVIFMVCKNTDSVNGSHILRGQINNSYVVITGKDYIGELQSPYVVVHHDIGITGSFASVPSRNLLDDFKIVAVRRNGNETSIFNTDGTTLSTIYETSLGFSEIGLDAFNTGSDWDFTGEYLKFEMYHGFAGDTKVIERINELKTLYNL